MTGPLRPRGPRQSSSRQKGSDEVPELTPEEVERRVDGRGGGAPLAPVERPVRDVRDLRRSRPSRSVARGSLLLLGLAAVGLIALRIMLPEGPVTASATTAPSDPAAAISSGAPPTLGPIGTPHLVTLPPMASPSGAPEPEPSPTLGAGQTPRPTPVATKAPTSTVSPTAPNRATVIVKMVVIKDSGGAQAAAAADWSIHVGGQGGAVATPNDFAGSASGTRVSIPAGQGYQITSNNARPDFAAYPIDSDCTRPFGAGLAAGQTVTCTITRDDRPRVRVITEVIGGSSSAANVIVTVSGFNATPSSFPGSEAGVFVVVGFGVTYTVSQSDLPGYAKSSFGACSGSLGLDKPPVECTFTFNAVPPTDPETDPPTDQPLAGAPLAWLLPVWGATALVGRRWWTTLRSR